MAGLCPRTQHSRLALRARGAKSGSRQLAEGKLLYGAQLLIEPFESLCLSSPVRFSACAGITEDVLSVFGDADDVTTKAQKGARFGGGIMQARGAYLWFQTRRV